MRESNMRQPRGATTADEPSVDWEAGGQWLGPFSASQGKVQRGSLLARGAWRPGVLGEQPPTLSASCYYCIRLEEATPIRL